MDWTQRSQWLSAGDPVTDAALWHRSGSQKQAGKSEGRLCPLLPGDGSQVCERRGVNVSSLPSCDPHSRVYPFLLPIKRDSHSWDVAWSQGCRENIHRLPHGKKIWTQAEGEHRLQSNTASCASGPATSPKTVDYFTLRAPFGTWQVMNQLFPLPQKKTKKGGGVKVCENFYACLVSSLELARRGWGSDPNHQQDRHQRASSEGISQASQSPGQHRGCWPGWQGHQRKQGMRVKELKITIELESLP